MGEACHQLCQADLTASFESDRQRLRASEAEPHSTNESLGHAHDEAEGKLGGKAQH